MSIIDIEKAIMEQKERTAVAVTILACDTSDEWFCFIQPEWRETSFAKELEKTKANDVLGYVGLSATSPHDSTRVFYIPGKDSDFFSWEIGSQVILALHRWMRDKGYPLDPYFFSVSVGTRR